MIHCSDRIVNVKCYGTSFQKKMKAQFADCVKAAYLLRMQQPTQHARANTSGLSGTAALPGIVDSLRSTVDRGETLPGEKRKAHLKALYKGIQKHERALLDALKTDLNKCETEAFSNEVGIVYAEISFILKRLKRWMRPRRIVPDLHLLPGKARVVRDPYGVSLIIAPWNYPVQLLLSPLVGALAGGNTVILKPSEVAPASAAALTRMVEDSLDPSVVRVVNGGPETSTALLDLPVDHIFFTGSVPVGKIVMEAASRRLTPLTLELGGKSPAVVAADADLEVAARRIAWGKFNNAGQTCVAPDYVLVHESVFAELVMYLKQALELFYGDRPQDNENYGRIINDRHWDRLAALAGPADRTSAPLLYGGGMDRDDRYIAPTLHGPVEDGDPLMQDEIFGPLLPIQTYRDTDEAIRRLRARPKPLAQYVFTRDRTTAYRFTREVPFGGGAINTTILHVASSRLPFGGVGPSGMGSYHGRHSFEAFTHPKSILTQPLRPDLGLAYPHRALDLAWVRKLLR